MKRDLTDLGVFDTKMSLYLLYRLREFATIGFTGFEGRHYSLFESLTEDLSSAVDLQALVTALAVKYQAQGILTLTHIPDSPFVESERRQIFFGAAIGIPTFFVRRDTSNQMQPQQLPHQYIERRTGRIVNERLYSDGIVRWLYSDVRENASVLYRLALGRRVSNLLGFLNYDLPLGGALAGNDRFLRETGINLDECVDQPESLDTTRKIFERKIRYWECRPMPEEKNVVVSPADSRVLVGSLDETSAVFLKGKFFDFEELLGSDKRHRNIFLFELPLRRSPNLHNGYDSRVAVFIGDPTRRLPRNG